MLCAGVTVPSRARPGRRRTRLWNHQHVRPSWAVYETAGALVCLCVSQGLLEQANHDPHERKGEVHWIRELLRRLQEVRANCKTRNQLIDMKVIQMLMTPLQENLNGDRGAAELTWYRRAPEPAARSAD